MKVIVRQKREKDCKRWFEMGKAYEENGRTDLAIRYYNPLLTRYPDHPHARLARERLDAIERENPPK